MRSKPFFLLSCLLSALAACSPKVPLTDKVVHLDLRLADGSSPARGLAGSDVRWTERLEIGGPQTELGAWSTRYCRVDPAANDRPGIALRGIVWDPLESTCRHASLSIL